MKPTLKFEPTFKNLFVNVTYKCNQRCQFCLLRYNKIKETTDVQFCKKLYKILHTNPDLTFAVKITGGEPFLRPERVRKLLYVCNEFGNIRDIGIGTNGTKPILDWVNVSHHPLHLYISRHDTGREWGLPPSVYIDNPLVDLRFNCNLFKGGVDSLDKILDYLAWARALGIRVVCFRELNKISIDNRSMYEQFIYDYIKWYKQNIVKLDDILEQLPKTFTPKYIKSNGYDTNYVYAYGDMKVIFRVIDEVSRIKKMMKRTGIGEFVIHPDGLVTGCWDRDLKRLEI